MRQAGQIALLRFPRADLADNLCSTPVCNAPNTLEAQPKSGLRENMMGRPPTLGPETASRGPGHATRSRKRPSGED